MVSPDRACCVPGLTLCRMIPLGPRVAESLDGAQRLDEDCKQRCSTECSWQRTLCERVWVRSAEAMQHCSPPLSMRVVRGIIPVSLLGHTSSQHRIMPSPTHRGKTKRSAIDHTLTICVGPYATALDQRADYESVLRHPPMRSTTY
eukprot:3417639-Rhodomonas_salina.3